MGTMIQYLIRSGKWSISLCGGIVNVYYWGKQASLKTVHAYYMAFWRRKNNRETKMFIDCQEPGGESMGDF